MATQKSLHAAQAGSTINLGRQRNFISGIQGVAAGGQASVVLPTDRRYHRLNWQVTAVNYTLGATGTKAGGATAANAVTVPTKALTGSGTGATIKFNTVNGQITAVNSVDAGGSGYAVGDTITPVDTTGNGAVITVATVSSGAIATVTLTSGGNPSAVDPSLAISTVKLIVGGVNVADLTAGQEILRAKFNNVTIGAGQLPIFFTEPWRNITRWPEITSWDMIGQPSFQIQMQFASSLVNPGLTGDMEFDYFINTSEGAVQAQLYSQLSPAPQRILSPISRHSFTFQLNAGLNIIGQGQIPFLNPILRLYFIGSIANQITQLEIDSDGNKVEESFIVTQNNGAQLGQLNEMLLEYGFQTSYFDAAYVADINNRIECALKTSSNLQLKIYSAQAQSLTIIQEKLTGSYSS